MIVRETRKNGTRRVALDFRKKDEKTGELVFVPGRTKQSFKKEVNINTIVAKAKKTGLLPHVNQGVYGDFSNVKSYHDAMNLMIQVGEDFDRLPARIRAKFDNDPSIFCEALSDPKNTEKLVEMGVLEPRKGSKTPVKAQGEAKTAEPKNPPSQPSPKGSKGEEKVSEGKVSS